MADLSVRNLTVEYQSGGYTVKAIDDLTFEASSGELVLLLGPSGCGKTTLLSCLAGILKPTAGSIRVGGEEVTALRGPALDTYRRSTVGIVFQAFNLIPSLTALENVEVPLRLAGKSRAAARERARDVLEYVGLEDRVKHKPADLSGGQQQRVAIARGMAHDPPVLLADEPTAHLDYVQVEGLLRLLRMLAAPGKLVVISTHDERLVPIADRVVELAPKTIARSRAPEVQRFAAGDVIFEQGSRGELIYVVESGTVDIVRVHDDGAEELLITVEPGAHFGELGPLLGFPRTATARASSDLVVTAYSVQDFRQRANVDPALARMIGQATKVVNLDGDGKKRPARAGTRAVGGRPRKPRTTGDGARQPVRNRRAP